MINQLTDPQRQVTQTFGKGLGVVAGAGSGKTSTLVAKVEVLLGQNPNAKVLAVSFTDRSAADLRVRMRDVLTKHKVSLEGHWFKTIHGLCLSIIKEFPAVSGYDGGETLLNTLEQNDLWTKALDKLWADRLPPDLESSLDRVLSLHSASSLMSLIKRVRELEPFGIEYSLKKNIDQRSLDLWLLSDYVLKTYSNFKKRKGKIDFLDLERGADQALRDRDVQRLLKKRFDLILVDEFQDTNLIQSKILKRIVKDDLSNLVVVGDPKQSIYRFRDAEMSLFEEWMMELPLNVELGHCFRSRPEIVRFINRVCEPLFEASGLNYQALIEARSTKQASDLDSVVKVHLDSGDSVALVIDALVKKGKRYNQIALLMRKLRGKSQQVIEDLTRQGIPLIVGSGGFFWDDPRVREMVSFLNWSVSFENKLSGLTFLRAPWVSWAGQITDHWIDQNHLHLGKTFLELQHPYSGVLKKARQFKARPSQILWDLLINDKIEGELSDAFLGLWHRCDELSAKGYDYAEVVAELKRCCDEDVRESSVPPGGDQGGVLILSIHGSKGLEFDTVVLVDFDVKPTTRSALPELFWDRKHGSYWTQRGLTGKKDEKDPLFLQFKERERIKELNEIKRVFYVALTRAKENLVLVLPCEPQEPIESQDPKKILNQDFWTGWVWQALQDVSLLEVKDQNLDQKRVFLKRDPDQRPIINDPSLTPVWGRARHSVTEWNSFSRCPRQYSWQFLKPHPRLKKQKKSQKNLGSLIHKALEKNSKALWEEIKEKWFEHVRLDLEEVVKKLDEPPILGTPGDAGSDRQTHWKQELWDDLMELKASVPAQKSYSEVAFELPLQMEQENIVLVGAIDQVFDLGDGNFLVWDYKWTTQDKPESVWKSLYAAQLSLYAWALKRLEPSVRSVCAEIIVILPSGVKRLGVNLREVPILKRAQEVVDFIKQYPFVDNQWVVGEHCQYCDFLSECQKSDKP